MERAFNLIRDSIKPYYLFDPCKTCALREFCGDECGRLLHPTDVNKSPVGDWVPAKKAARVIKISA